MTKQVSTSNDYHIPYLVKSLHSTTIEVRINACRSLKNGVSFARTRDGAFRANAVPPLIDMLKLNHATAQKLAVETLEVLSSQVPPNLALDPDAMRIIVSLLSSTDVNVHLSAARLLQNIIVHVAAQLIAIDEEAIPPLVKLLSSPDAHVANAACKTLRNICRTNDRAQAAAVDVGAVPPLVRLLSVHMHNESAMQTLRYLSSVAREEGSSLEVFDALVRLLASKDPHVLHSAVEALKRFSVSGAGAMMALKSNAIPALVCLIDSSSHNANVLRSAAEALRNITAIPAAETFALDANTIPPLVKLLRAGDIDTEIAACYALKHICWSKDQPRYIAWRAGAVHALLKLLRHPGTSEQLQQAAIETLDVICPLGPPPWTFSISANTCLVVAVLSLFALRFLWPLYNSFFCSCHE